MAAASPPIFSPADIRHLFRVCVSSSPPASTPAPCLELIDGSGVITERKARDEIEQRICAPSDDRTRTSTFELASALSLQPRTVEDLLPTHVPGWGRVGAFTILTTREFSRLRALLREELQRHTVHSAEFCRNNEVDVELFRRLLPSKGEAATEGSWVYALEYWGRMKAKLEETLKTVVVPLGFAELLVEEAVPPTLVGKMLGELAREGAVDGRVAAGRFVPGVYVKAQQDALVEELRREGVLAVDALEKEGVLDPEAFIGERLSTARRLDQHFVTEAYISHLESLVQDRLETSQWSDVKDPDNRLTASDEKLLRQHLLTSLPSATLLSDLLIPASLPTTLTSQVQSLGASLASSSYSPPSSSSSSSNPAPAPAPAPQDLRKHLSASTTLPPALLTHFSTTLLPAATTSFSARLSELRAHDLAAAKEAFTEKAYLKFAVHLRAVQRLVDVGLKAKLAADLGEWVRTQAAVGRFLAQVENMAVPAEAQAAETEDWEGKVQAVRALLSETEEKEKEKEEKKGKGRDKKKPPPELSRLEKLDAAFRALVAPAENEERSLSAKVEEKHAQMVKELQTQLVAPAAEKDPSKMLLLALILVHARGVGGGGGEGQRSDGANGVLRATGKYVPKLLKELEKRGAVAAEEVRVLAEVKAAVVARREVGKELSAEVRRVGLGAAASGDGDGGEGGDSKNNADEGREEGDEAGDEEREREVEGEREVER